MQKDINVPKVTHVFMAVVKEFNKTFNCNDWNVYIINNKEVTLEQVLIVSKGFDKELQKETSVLRHKIEILPPNSFAKVELLQEDVLNLTNLFSVIFFEGSKLYDKTFIFEKGTIKEGNLQTLPLLKKRGILAK